MARIKTNHKVFNISYHITWIPKYRKHILTEKIRELTLKYLFEKTISLNISIEAIEVMDDHIHLFIKARPDLTISYIVQQLKGYTSYKIRKEFPSLKKYKTLWTHSYFIETIGCISENTVKKYIELQKKSTLKNDIYILYSKYHYYQYNYLWK